LEQFKVKFIPDNKLVMVDKGTTVMAAALSAQIRLNAACGGDGVCGKCRVIIKSGYAATESSERVSVLERQRGLHLACQTLVISDLEIEVPSESRLDLGALSREEQELRLRGLYGKAEAVEEVSRSLGAKDFTIQPLVEKFYFELTQPDFNDKISDLERVLRALAGKIGEVPVRESLSGIRRLGELLRSCDWKLTVTIFRKGDSAEILAIEAGDRTRYHYGLIFDIGTTTVSGQLLDINSKKILGTKVAMNRQATFGSDVITRIIYAQAPDGLEKLHHAVVDVMNEMIESFSGEYRVDLNDVTVISVAGNTTMIHLLLKIDPKHIRQQPYVPTANFIPVVKASEVGLKIHPHGLLFCAPGVASYVGGDITAGVLACGIYKTSGVELLIDIGTNGEIALGNSEWVISAAASAGPAFEGSGMSCGLRAVRGAVQGVKIDIKTLDVSLKTIGGDKPRGICGSGYIELVCELLRFGALDKNGKLNRSLMNKRLRQGREGYEFVVAYAADAGVDTDIVITDADLDNFKRAKAAIYSAVSVLAAHMDMKVGDIHKIYIAGGFGTSLNIESAVTIGLIPDISREKYVFVGNSSLAGARLNLLSRPASSMLDKIASSITYFELSSDPAYMDEYMAALFFPHTDAGRFPSVRYSHG
jgi:uncharacterized 2Fe-2S/4Fe-4S cluster protein (DUF4445 family)